MMKTYYYKLFAWLRLPTIHRETVQQTEKIVNSFIVKQTIRKQLFIFSGENKSKLARKIKSLHKHAFIYLVQCIQINIFSRLNSGDGKRVSFFNAFIESNNRIGIS